jgi:hypothetical protein
MRGKLASFRAALLGNNLEPTSHAARPDARGHFSTRSADRSEAQDGTKLRPVAWELRFVHGLARLRSLRDCASLIAETFA